MFARPRSVRQLLLVVALAFVAAPSAFAADDVLIGGVNPDDEPIVATFSCYPEVPGDQYSQPSAVLEVLPGRRYRLGGQEGTFGVKEGETLSVTWLTGPLGGAPYESAARFDDWGQTITITPPNDQPDLTCYQQGARERLAQQEFQIKDPLTTAAYACVDDATGAAAPPIEFLPGRAYRFNGAAGTYGIDLLRAQDDDSAYITFTSGPLLDENAFSSGDAETGVRTVNVYATPKLKCTVLGPPLAPPRFGPGRVARGPKGPALEGTYGKYEIDVVGLCGGLCWSYYTFTDTGRVYTRAPKTSLADAACTRNLPNGLPLCDTYTLGRRSLRIGTEPPQSFSRNRKGIKIDGDQYLKVTPLTVKRLRGKFTSTTAFTTPGVGSAFSQRTFTFAADGTFTREGFSGATSGSTVATGDSRNAGKYTISKNTITLRFNDGGVARSFIWAFNGDGNRARPKNLRIGTSDYSPE